ncbi:ATP-binding protein [Candidatus Micrarchaeota archaeon]|nr:ATP-binding protein [Candidatus Micrarchaeota archaeon]
MADLAKLRALEELNPWWLTGEVPSGLLGLERREHLAEITRNLDKDDVTIVSGIRRSGKTTLLYQTIASLLREKKVNPRNILLVNCDDATMENLFEGVHDIVSTFNASAEGKKYVFLDEVQYFRDWERQLKNAYDRFRKTVKLVVSGSSAVLSKSRDMYLLTGRFWPVSVHPFSFREFLELKGVKLQDAADWYAEYAPLDLDRRLQQYLEYGGFPQIITEDDPAEKTKIARLYLETIIYKDIIKLWEVKDAAALERLCRFLLQNIGQRFSYRRVADTLQTNLKTTQNYIEYLSNSFLICFVEHYSGSSAQQIKKEKKVFAADNALHTAFFKAGDFGSLAENAVFNHLKRKHAKLHYWKNKHEADFVFEDDGVPVPVEVKYQRALNPEDFKCFHSFFKHFSSSRGGVLVTRNDFGTKRTDDGRTIRIVPLWLFLLE